MVSKVLELHARNVWCLTQSIQHCKVFMYHVQIMPELHRQNAINQTKALTKYLYSASSGPNKIIAKILS